MFRLKEGDSRSRIGTRKLEASKHSQLEYAWGSLDRQVLTMKVASAPEISRSVILSLGFMAISALTVKGQRSESAIILRDGTVCPSELRARLTDQRKQIPAFLAIQILQTLFLGFHRFQLLGLDQSFREVIDVSHPFDDPSRVFGRLVHMIRKRSLRYRSNIPDLPKLYLNLES
jgi:hypothetical protein